MIRRKIEFEGCVIWLCPDVYAPSDDSFLLARYIQRIPRGNEGLALDLGTGTGFLAILAAKKSFNVVATDINPSSARCVEVNARYNGVEGKISFRFGDMFKCMKENEKFDLIIFNPPYIPEKREGSDFLALAWKGGGKGRQLIDIFLKEVKKYLKPNGKAVFVQTNLNDLNETLNLCRKLKITCKVIKTKKLFFQELHLVELTVSDS